MEESSSEKTERGEVDSAPTCILKRRGSGGGGGGGGDRAPDRVPDRERVADDETPRKDFSREKDAAGAGRSQAPLHNEPNNRNPSSPRVAAEGNDANGRRSAAVAVPSANNAGGGGGGRSASGGMSRIADQGEARERTYEDEGTETEEAGDAATATASVVSRRGDRDGWFEAAVGGGASVASSSAAVVRGDGWSEAAAGSSRPGAYHVVPAAVHQDQHQEAASAPPPSYEAAVGDRDHPPMVEAYAVDENYDSEWQGRTAPTSPTTVATVVERRTVCGIERTRLALLVAALGILALVGAVLGIALSDNNDGGGGGGGSAAPGTATLSDDTGGGNSTAAAVPPAPATLGQPNCPPAEPVQTGSTPLQFCDDADEDAIAASCWVQVGSDLVGQFDPDERFGNRVALASSGDRFLVSAPTTDTCEGEEAGVVRVYDVVVDGDGDGGGGVPTIAQVGGDLLGSKGGDKLTGALSRDGSRVAVGAQFWNSPETQKLNPEGHVSESSEGQVRVYELRKNGDGRGESSWEPVGLPIDGKTWKERTGRSVALSPSGDIVAAGAPDYDSHLGVVRVYKEDKVNATFSRWEQMGSNIIGTDIVGSFGFSMSFSDDGETLVVGQKLKEGVRVFRYESASADWVQLGNVIRGLEPGGNFGRWVSIASDGNTISVGAYLGDTFNGEDSGQVRIFAYDEAEKVWDQVGDDIDGDAARTWLNPNSLSANGRRIAVGTGVADEMRGYARVYDLVGDAWEQVGGTIRGQKVGEDSGVDISLAPDGQRLLVGGKGVVRLFELRSI